MNTKCIVYMFTICPSSTILLNNYFFLIAGLLILLSHVSPHLSSSQNLDIYHRHKRHTGTAVVSLHASLNLKTPDFPKCCQPFTFLIEYGGREGTGYIRLLFDDLDLPKASTLQVSTFLLDTLFFQMMTKRNFPCGGNHGVFKWACPNPK